LTDPREYPIAPMVGVGAVVVREDCILLVRRGKAPLAGEWSLPGGAVELGETLEEAIVREVAEETGVQVTPIQVLQAFDHIDRDADGRIRFHYVLVDFLCSVESPGGVGAPERTNCELRPASDVSDARWVRWEGRRTLEEFSLTERALEVIAAGWSARKRG
jgi:8-oxo-dGTP diphosphatase